MNPNAKGKKIKDILSYLQEDVPDGATPPDEQPAEDDFATATEPTPVTGTNLKPRRKRTFP